MEFEFFVSPNENVEWSEKASVAKMRAKMRAKRASELRLHYFFSDNFNMENKLENSKNFFTIFRVICARSFARSALLSGYLGKSGHLHSFYLNFLLCDLLICFMQYSSATQCLKIAQNVSINIASEASYVYILNGQKFIKYQKIEHFGDFLKT